MGYETKKVGNEYALVKHDSLKIDPNKNAFKWHSKQNVQGGVIQLAQQLEGLTWRNAVLKLVGEQYSNDKFINNNINKNCRKENKQFIKPTFDDNMKNAYAYLIHERKIDSEIVSYYAKKNLIKQISNKSHKNIAFISYDEKGEMKYISLRGASSNSKFKGEIVGSDKEYGFKQIGTNEKLFVFESPIDMLSYQTREKIYGLDWKNNNYISLGGVSDNALLKFLESNKGIKNIYLSLDIDEAGNKATKEIESKLKKLYPNIKINRNIPTHGKDFNETWVVEKTIFDYTAKGIDYDVIAPFIKENLNLDENFSKERLTNVIDNQELFIYENVEDFFSVSTLAKSFNKEWQSKNFIVSNDEKYLDFILNLIEDTKNITFCFSQKNLNLEKVNYLKNKYSGKYNVNIHNSKDETYLKSLNDFQKKQSKDEQSLAYAR